MRRMNVIMRNDNQDDGGAGGGSIGAMTTSASTGKYECDNCRAEFPNKTTVERHMLFCRTLAEIRRGSVSTHHPTTLNDDDDALRPTPREMFVLIQELAAKYNKVKDELDVMKEWAKMVGRRINSAAGGGVGAAAGLDFTSVTRQKRQNMEVILNEEDAEHPDLAMLRPGFAEWITSPSLVVTDTDLHMVFNEDLVAGLTAAILRVLSQHTVESGRSHLIPFKLADIKQGAFYIYDTAFGAPLTPPSENATDLPTPRKWRAMEPCEFQLFVRTFHKLLFKEFKKWQDRHWEAQKQMTQQRQKAASSYHHVMSSFQCSPAMMSCDGMYATGGSGAGGVMDDAVDDDIDMMPTTPVSEPVLSEDFATLYNKYADKMMGGALSDETILLRVKTKLWKDMKAWRL